MRLAHRTRSALLVAVGASAAILVGIDGSPGWRALRVGVAVAVVGFAAWLPDRRSTDVAHVVVAVGVLAIGAGFFPHLVKTPGSVAGFAAAAAVLGGLVLLVASTASLLRGAGRMRGVAGGALVVVATVSCLMVVAPAILVTNVPDTDVGEDPATRGLEFEDVSLITADGVRLAAWYVPSEGGAAVVLRHGAGSTRSNVLGEAEVLARHGYGVLLVDARGHGDSEGRAMDFGWHGDLDIAAATEHLLTRADVEPDRIGVVGMSMGGEEAIGAAAADERIRAVVAEGATARIAADKAWLSDVYGVRGWLQEQIERLQYGLTDLLTDADRPVALPAAVGRADGVAFLLIAAGDVADESHAARHLAEVAPGRVEVWTVPGVGHTEGLDRQPEEWERRVVRFLDAHL